MHITWRTHPRHFRWGKRDAERSSRLLIALPSARWMFLSFSLRRVAARNKKPSRPSSFQLMKQISVLCGGVWQLRRLKISHDVECSTFLLNVNRSSLTCWSRITADGHVTSASGPPPLAGDVNERKMVKGRKKKNYKKVIHTKEPLKANDEDDVKTHKMFSSRASEYCYSGRELGRARASHFHGVVDNNKVKSINTINSICNESRRGFSAGFPAAKRSAHCETLDFN